MPTWQFDLAVVLPSGNSTLSAEWLFRVKGLLVGLYGSSSETIPAEVVPQHKLLAGHARGLLERHMSFVGVRSSDETVSSLPRPKRLQPLHTRPRVQDVGSRLKAVAGERLL